MAFAEGTRTSPEKSQGELLSVLRHYGAVDYAAGEGAGHAWVEFSYRKRHIRVAQKLPDPNDKKWRRGARDKVLTLRQAEKKVEDERWRRWRVLLLRVKAKLEAVNDGDVSMDEEFMPFYVLPGGRTLLEALQPALGDMGLLARQLTTPALPPPREVPIDAEFAQKGE